MIQTHTTIPFYWSWLCFIAWQNLVWESAGAVIHTGFAANGKVCVWQTATRHLREKKTTTAQIWNLFWVTEEELILRQRECVSEQTFVSYFSYLCSNCRNPNSFDIDWGFVLSNETPCKRRLKPHLFFLSSKPEVQYVFVINLPEFELMVPKK